MSIPESKLAELRSIHGDVTVITESGKTFAIVPPPEAMVDAVFDTIFAARLSGGGGSGLATAYANCAAVSTVYPAEAERDALFKRYRQLQIAVGMSAYRLSTGPRADEEKKELPSSSEPKTT